MNNWKLHNIVESIRADGRFSFNVEDIEEDLSEVLAFYNIGDFLEQNEVKVLQRDLIEMALQEEFAEASRLAGVEA